MIVKRGSPFKEENMTSTLILKIFIIEFIALAVMAVIKKDTGLALYGIGGAILNYGVLIGMK